MIDVLNMGDRAQIEVDKKCFVLFPGVCCCRSDLHVHRHRGACQCCRHGIDMTNIHLTIAMLIIICTSHASLYE